MGRRERYGDEALIASRHGESEPGNKFEVRNPKFEENGAARALEMSR
jgi:hypothetical protein